MRAGPLIDREAQRRRHERRRVWGTQAVEVRARLAAQLYIHAGPLLDREKGGEFTVEGVDSAVVGQEYLENTNVLRTIFSGAGGSFELLDFAPRFIQPVYGARLVQEVVGERIGVQRFIAHGKVKELPCT